MSADVVAVLTYRTWADGHGNDDHVQLGQALVNRLVQDVAVPSVTIVDPLRNWLKALATPGTGGSTSRAGRPAVASDLPPVVHGISDRVLLVPPGGPYAPAVLAASMLSDQTPDEIAAFRSASDGTARYARFKQAALGAVEVGTR